MRKLVGVAAVGAVLLSGGAVALAQGTSPWPSVTVTPTVSPKTAGTKSHPQGVKLKTVFNWTTLGAASQPIVTSFKILFPKGSLYNGSKYPKCSESTLSASGPAGCKTKSIMGKGTGTAYADTTVTNPAITVVNGGPSKIWFYTVLNNPARVQEPVPGYITKMSGKWAYSLSVTVPQNLQIVAGVPIELTNLSVTAGGPAHGTWIATTGCSNGKWPYKVTTTYLNPNTDATGSSSYTASVHCKK